MQAVSSYNYDKKENVLQASKTQYRIHHYKHNLLRINSNNKKHEFVTYKKEKLKVFSPIFL